jgi:uncharacterized linocin/CFP29 family protein
MNFGREKLDSWSPELWNRIDQAVSAEAMRTKVGAKFLQHFEVASDTLTVPAETVKTNESTLVVDESAVTPLIEIWVEFTLTPQQVEREAELMTAVTLATRAANILSEAEDTLLFQGDTAIEEHPLFQNGNVSYRSGPAGTGLLNAEFPFGDAQVIEVKAVDAAEQRFGENTFEAVAEGYSILQSGYGGKTQAHYGPYALVLQTIPYADTHAPLRSTLIMPADRIAPLVPAGFHGTGTIPELTGFLISLGGRTVDLVIGCDTTTAFMQEDPEGRYRFRVLERFALKLKDPTAIIKLEFKLDQEREGDREGEGEEG